MKAFKVVRNCDDELWSAVMNLGYSSSLPVIYNKDKWVVPNVKNTLLFAFKEYEQAKKFFDTERDSKNLELWECDVADVVEIQVMGSLNYANYFWQSFWRNPNSPTHTLGLAPKGTIGTSALRLTRKLYPYYKVVDVQDDHYRSARCGDVDYYLNRPTIAPKGTKLFVFSELEDARHFAAFGEVIFECEVKNPTPGVAAEIEANLIFWRVLNKHLESGGTINDFYAYALSAVKGCYWADEVILRTRI